MKRKTFARLMLEQAVKNGYTTIGALRIVWASGRAIDLVLKGAVGK